MRHIDELLERVPASSDWIDEEDTLFEDLIPTQPRIILPVELSASATPARRAVA